MSLKTQKKVCGLHQLFEKKIACDCLLSNILDWWIACPPAGSINQLQFKITWSSGDAHTLKEIMEAAFNSKGKKMVFKLIGFNRWSKMWLNKIFNFAHYRYEKLWVFISIRAWQEVFWGAKFTVCFVAGTDVHIKNLKWYRGWWIWCQAIHSELPLPFFGSIFSLSGLFNKWLKPSGYWHMLPLCAFAGKVFHATSSPSKAERDPMFWPVVQWPHRNSDVLGCVADKTRKQQPQTKHGVQCSWATMES